MEHPSGSVQRRTAIHPPILYHHEAAGGDVGGIPFDDAVDPVKEGQYGRLDVRPL